MDEYFDLLKVFVQVDEPNHYDRCLEVFKNVEEFIVLKNGYSKMEYLKAICFQIKQIILTNKDYFDQMIQHIPWANFIGFLYSDLLTKYKSPYNSYVQSCILNVLFRPEVLISNIELFDVKVKVVKGKINPIDKELIFQILGESKKLQMLMNEISPVNVNSMDKIFQFLDDDINLIDNIYFFGITCYDGTVIFQEDIFIRDDPIGKAIRLITIIHELCFHRHRIVNSDNVLIKTPERFGLTQNGQKQVPEAGNYFESEIFGQVILADNINEEQAEEILKVENWVIENGFENLKKYFKEPKQMIMTQCKMISEEYKIRHQSGYSPPKYKCGNHLVLLLPHSFEGLDYIYHIAQRKYYNLVPQERITGSLGANVLKNFSQCITNTLEAIADNDQEYLKNPNLHNAVSHCLEMHKNKEIKLKYIDHVESEEEFHAQFEKPKIFDLEKIMKNEVTEIDHIYGEPGFLLNLDVKGIFGPSIIRSQNIDKKFHQIPPFASRFAFRKYLVNLLNPYDIIKNQVLIVNVLFRTQRKIAGFKDGVVIYGSNDPTEWQDHKWRFETYTPEIDWTITDIDDYLKGNPYQ